MKTKQEIVNLIVEQGMLPLFFNTSEEISIEITRTLYKAGVRIIEYTNRGERALVNFKALKNLQQTELPDLILGIGTIKTANQANEFVAAGTDFLISPIVSAEVAEIAASHNMLWIPGCMTPTEIHTAQNFNVPLIKIFPANILGPGFVSSIKELFPGQLFMPTGGVELEQENITSWFKAGVCAVGMGSKLITKQVMENHDYNRLYKDTLVAAALIKAGR